MKKSFLKLSTLLLISFTLFSCNDKNDPNKNNDSADNTQETQDDPSLMVKNINDVCAYLENKNIVHGEKLEMRADMIGAIKGYSWENPFIEVYEFESDAPVSITVLEYTFNFDARNKQFGLVFSFGMPIEDDVKTNAINAFNAMIVVK